MKNWSQVASDESIQKAVESLKANGIEAIVVSDKEEAKKRLFEILPNGAEVMTMTSVSLDSAGVTNVINESGTYNSLKAKLKTMDRATQGMEMNKLGAAPEWTVGSVNAVTEDGKVVIASNTGSQLGAYAYRAAHVIWVVGTQKIVKNLDEAMKRIYDYVLPLESERLAKAFGKPIASNVSKLLIVSKEVRPDRVTLILVKEPLGF